MTVKEMIEKLSALDPDMIVLLSTPKHHSLYEDVTLIVPELEMSLMIGDEIKNVIPLIITAS